MMKAFRRRAPLLLAAAAFGLTRPAAGQTLQPLPQAPGTADDTLPRVVPSRRPPVAPIAQAAPAAPAAPNQPSLDLLTAPALPTAWSAPPAKRAVASALPPKAPAAVRPVAASYPASMTPPVPATRTAAPGAGDGPLRAVSRPPMLSAPVVASARPMAQPAPPKKTWPAAFQTRDDSRPYQTTGVVSFEKPTQPVKQVAAVKSAPPAVAPAAGDLRGRIMTLCGPDAAEVVVADQPDRTTLVKVRVRDAAAGQKAMEAILKLPEMARPTVHLEMEVKP